MEGCSLGRGTACEERAVGSTAGVLSVSLSVPRGALVAS